MMNTDFNRSQNRYPLMGWGCFSLKMWQACVVAATFVLVSGCAQQPTKPATKSTTLQKVIAQPSVQQTSSQSTTQTQSAPQKSTAEPTQSSISRSRVPSSDSTSYVAKSAPLTSTTNHESTRPSKSADKVVQNSPVTNTQAKTTPSSNHHAQDQLSVAHKEKPTVATNAIVTPSVQKASQSQATSKSKPVAQPEPQETANKGASKSKVLAEENIALAKTEQQPAKTDEAPLEEAPLFKALEQLPLAYEGWTLDLSRSARYVKDGCYLESPTIRMQDGQGGTPASWEFSLTQVIFHTRSNIDLAYEQTGLTIGSNHWPLQNLRNETAIDFSDHAAVILKAMLQHDDMEIAVGFWPTWPVTHAFTGRWSTVNFDRLYTALNDCERKWRNP